MTRSFAIAVLAAVLGVACCGLSAGEQDKPRKAAEPPFHEQLKNIAAEYRGYGRVDDEMRWAPFLCRMPMPGSARVSASKDEKTHGQKLYSLFARDRKSYWAFDPKKPAAVGQVLVKQSWVPEEVAGKKGEARPDPELGPRRSEVIVTPASKGDKRFESADHFWPYASKGGKTYKAVKQADLFVMFKLDPKTPNTDEGWVYGTVTPDGKTVTSAGRVESCMKCHQEKANRLFGLRP